MFLRHVPQFKYDLPRPTADSPRNRTPSKLSQKWSERGNCVLGSGFTGVGTFRRRGKLSILGEYTSIHYRI